MLSKRERICSEAIDELRRYLDFKSGWDGYDGLPFRAEDVECAERIVQQLCSRFAFSIAELTEIVPGPISDGRIDVYAVADARSVTFTVDPDARSILISYKDRREGCEGTTTSNERSLGRWFDWLAGTPCLPSLFGEIET